MTQRLKGLRVYFEKDIREDDAQEIINAIKIIRNVLDVQPIDTSFDDGIIETRVKHAILTKLYEVLK